MKIIALFTGLLCFVGLISACTSNTSTAEKQTAFDVETIVNGFAPLECRAIALREQRFALANQIRFTQDTLLHSPGKKEAVRLQAKLDALNIERERTTQRSLALADSIKLTLDSLMANQLTRQEDKEQFTQMLHIALEKMNCKDM